MILKISVDMEDGTVFEADMPITGKDTRNEGSIELLTALNMCFHNIVYQLSKNVAKKEKEIQDAVLSGNDKK